MGTCNLEALSRTLLIIINVIFIALGLVLAAFGIVIAIGSNIFGGYIEPLFRDGTASVGSFFSYVAISAAVLGSLILIFAMIGVCGACCKNSCLLYGYAGLLTFFLLVEIAIVIVCILKWDWVTSQLKGALQTSLDDSYTGPKATDSLSVAWNYAFVTFQCCGVSNSSDLTTAKKWNTSDKVPGTCCKVTGTFPDHSDPIDGNCTTLPTTDNSYYHKGCYDSILDLILQYNDYIIGVAAVVGALQIVTLLASIFLARSGNKVHPSK